MYLPEGGTGGTISPGPGEATRSRHQGAKILRVGRYCRAQGNEVRQDEWQEVGAPHITCEAGERTPKDPVEGREVSGYGIVGGKDTEHIRVR